MLKKGIALSLALLLCLALLPVRAENAAILGQPFPDFTAVDTEGNTFTLSEALKEKKAVLINLWATWCPPCQAEFPYLDEAYAQRADDVAVIALSIEGEDTLEAIAEFKNNLGLSLPMGRDEGEALSDYVQVYYIPTTVIVDRFGNACFMDSGAITSADAFLRLMDAFLGDDYTASRVLDELPPARVWDAGVEGARKISLTYEGQNVVDAAWIVDGKEADFIFRLLEGAVQDDYLEIDWSDQTDLDSLYDSADGAYHFHAEIPDQADYLIVALCTGEGEMTMMMLLFRDENGLRTLADDYFAGETLDWAEIDE
ncbi:MAG: TlpA family protein disulfide reductase [Clostridiales bacterium]|nr:TlpA family protein disulfide reductase [Clostridiales bacterium]